MTAAGGVTSSRSILATQFQDIGALSSTLLVPAYASHQSPSTFASGQLLPYRVRALRYARTTSRAAYVGGCGRPNCLLMHLASPSAPVRVAAALSFLLAGSSVITTPSSVQAEVEKVVVEPAKRGKPGSNGGSSVTPVGKVDLTWPTQGRIEFQDFSASYRPMVLEDSLKHVTFTVCSRQKVGIVGRTGAGKSSLVLALLRVLKSTNGRILIDGVDIASVPLPRLRTAITVIPQDPNLVRGTLRANLDPTQKHSDEELWQVLRQANLAEFVSRQPPKLLLETGDGGGNLSAGQRQLVCLARALLRRPMVLVLDEATSHMDGDTDRLIQATLRDSFANFTLLTVAHRLHTVLDYDRILVMSEGTVVEYGRLDELLSDRKSVFYDMATKAGIVPSCLPEPLPEPSATHL